MFDDEDDLERKRLEVQLAHLFQLREASLRSWKAVKETDQIRIDEEMEGYERQINEKRAKLKELESRSRDPNRRRLNYDENVPNIDYEEAFGVFEKVLKKHFKFGKGAALFIAEQLSDERRSINQTDQESL